MHKGYAGKAAKQLPVSSSDWLLTVSPKDNHKSSAATKKLLKRHPDWHDELPTSSTVDEAMPARDSAIVIAATRVSDSGAQHSCAAGNFGILAGRTTKFVPQHIQPEKVARRKDH